MSSTAPFDIGTLITCTPGVYGGRPCLAGKRFPVSMVATHFATLGAEGIRVIVEDYGMDEVKVPNAELHLFDPLKSQGLCHMTFLVWLVLDMLVGSTAVEMVTKMMSK